VTTSGGGVIGMDEAVKFLGQQLRSRENLGLCSARIGLHFPRVCLIAGDKGRVAGLKQVHGHDR